MWHRVACLLTPSSRECSRRACVGTPRSVGAETAWQKGGTSTVSSSSVAQVDIRRDADLPLKRLCFVKRSCFVYTLDEVLTLLDVIVAIRQRKGSVYTLSGLEGNWLRCWCRVWAEIWLDLFLCLVAVLFASRRFWQVTRASACVALCASAGFYAGGVACAFLLRWTLPFLVWFGSRLLVVRRRGSAVSMYCVDRSIDYVKGAEGRSTATRRFHVTTLLFWVCL